MTQIENITANEVISGVCRKIKDHYGDSIHIYKEKQPHIEFPASVVYLMQQQQVMERYDRFTNIFHIIINYFTEDSVKIKNKRTDMFSNAVKIMECIRYIDLPSYSKDASGQLIPSTLPCKASSMEVEEGEGFMQIAVSYTVRTKKYNDMDKMRQLQLDVTTK